MAWFPSNAARRTLDSMSERAELETGISNAYVWQGRSYFWQPDDVEYEDGSASGYLLVSEEHGSCSEVGRWKIDGTTGDVVEGDLGFRELARRRQ